MPSLNRNLKSHKRKIALPALLVAQFMGAANDNILKTLLSFAVIDGIWAGELGKGGQGLIALFLFIPFILFSGWAGPIADRFSKRSISVNMKILEVPLALLGGLGFILGYFWLGAIAMVVLAIQSTFFGPAKYGMIPELVPKEAVSKANGLLNMFTNIAIIIGTLIAGLISAPPPPVTLCVVGEDQSIVIPEEATFGGGKVEVVHVATTDAYEAYLVDNVVDIVLVDCDSNEVNPSSVIESTGLYLPSATVLGFTAPSFSNINLVEENARFFSNFIQMGGSDLYKLPEESYEMSCRVIRLRHQGVAQYMPGIVFLCVAGLGLAAIVLLPPLPPIQPKTHIPVNAFGSYISTIKEMCQSSIMLCSIAWASFYLLGCVVLLVVMELGQVLGVDKFSISVLLASIGASVGLGSLFAGYMSKGDIRIKLSRVGAILMAITLLLAGLITPSFWQMLFTLAFMGFFAGMYTVPIQSLLQTLPNPECRGRILGTSNAISFTFMAIGSLLYAACRDNFGISPQQTFLACGLIAFVCWLTTFALDKATISNEK